MISTQAEFPPTPRPEGTSGAAWSYYDPFADPPKVPKGARAERHSLRDQAGRLIGGRTGRCGRARTGPVVELWRFEGGGAGFTCVETCGSVWACPVCASKVAEQRREQLRDVVKAHRATGGETYLLTLTLPHGSFDRCSSLRATVANAWRLVQAGAPWQRIKAAFGIVGYVRSLEVTHGENGWHPHLHVLIGTRRPLDQVDVALAHRRLFDRWRAMVAKISGKECLFEASRFHQASAADYVSKWGAVEEITRSVSKLGRNGGRSPWQLLRDVRDDGDAEAADLFKEYARAFKGARHLTWSRDWRHLCGLDDVDLAAQTVEETGELPKLDTAQSTGRIGFFDHGTWRAILKHRLTGAVLDAAARGGWPEVQSLLARFGLGSYYDGREVGDPPHVRSRPRLDRSFPFHLWEPTEANLARYFAVYGPHARRS